MRKIKPSTLNNSNAYYRLPDTPMAVENELLLSDGTAVEHFCLKKTRENSRLHGNLDSWTQAQKLIPNEIHKENLQ